METAPAPDGLPPSLRFLKFLVIVLTLTMIVGVITIVAIIVTRMPVAMQGMPEDAGQRAAARRGEGDGVHARRATGMRW